MSLRGLGGSAEQSRCPDCSGWTLAPVERQKTSSTDCQRDGAFLGGNNNP